MSLTFASWNSSAKVLHDSNLCESGAAYACFVSTVTVHSRDRGLLHRERPHAGPGFQRGISRGRQQHSRARCVEGLSKKISLAILTAELGELREVRGGLDTLGDDLELQRMRQSNDRARRCRIVPPTSR